MSEFTVEVKVKGRRYLVTFETMLVAVSVLAIGIDRRSTGARRGSVAGMRRLRLDGPKARQAIAATGKLRPDMTKELYK